jgi:hypothetical protein
MPGASARLLVAASVAVAAAQAGLVLSSCNGRGCGEWDSYSFDPRLRAITNKVAVGTGGALAVNQTSRPVAEYQPRDSGTTEDLLDVWADGNYFDCSYVAVGRKGTVRVSTDEGEHWTAVSEPAIGADLRGVDVECGKDSYAVAVGDAGAVLVGTLSGDGLWQVAPPPTSRRLNAVALAIGRRATAVGEEGLVLRSVDGGMTWATVPVDTKEELLDIEIDRDAGNGYIVGAAGTLLQSGPDGVWTRVETGTDDDLRQVVDRGGGVRILGNSRLFTWDFTRTGPLVADHELGQPIVAMASLGVTAAGGPHPTDSVLALAENGRLLVYIEPDACDVSN